METNPSTMIPTPVIPEVNQALTMTDSYVDSGTNKLAQVASIIGGDAAKTYGVTNENIKRVMMFVGAYTSLKFLYDRGFKYKWQVLGTAVAIYALRVQFSNDSLPITLASSNTTPKITPSV